MSSRTLLAAALALALGGVNGDDLPMPPPVFPTPQAETPVGGTPNGYVAWVTGLSAGDTVTATMWFKGASNGVDDDGKGKIWGQYTSNDDITAYENSAPGPSAYAGEGGVWTQSSHTWTIDAGRTALVIEARMYSDGSNNILLGDDLTVSTNNDGAKITLAGGTNEPDCKACAKQGDCTTGEICEVGPSRRRLRFGLHQDGCCRVPVAV